MLQRLEASQSGQGLTMMSNDNLTINEALGNYFDDLYYSCYLDGKHEPGFVTFTSQQILVLSRDFRELLLNDLNINVIYDYIKKEQLKGVSNRTINKRLGVLRRASQFNHFKGDLSDFNLLRALFTTYRRISAQELEKADRLTNFFPLTESLIYLLFRKLGLTTDELLNLTVRDVLFNSGQLFIRASDNGAGRYVSIETGDLKKRLSKHFISNRKAFKDKGRFLFSAYKRSPNKLNMLFRKIREASEVNTITANRLRYTLASELYESGYSTEYIGGMLGEANTEKLKRYIFINHNGDDLSLAIYEKLKGAKNDTR